MICKLCGEDYKHITHAHLLTHGISTKEYKEEYGKDSTVDPAYRKKMSKARKGIVNLGDKNGAKRPEVRRRISDSVSLLWEQGVYDERINGMLGTAGDKHPNWLASKHTLEHQAAEQWRDFLSNFQDIKVCSRCGESDSITNVHHVDEDHKNILPSNLEPLCVPCHTMFHYERRQQPYSSVGKLFKFVAAHKLPNHKGKCKQWHGHNFVCAVWIRKRVDPDTDMVIDFGDLKTMVEHHVVDKLDHGVLNDFIPNPTAENIAVWVWNRLMFEGKLKGIYKIVVKESDTSIAEVTVEDRLSSFYSVVKAYDKNK